MQQPVNQPMEAGTMERLGRADRVAVHLPESFPPIITGMGGKSGAFEVSDCVHACAFRCDGQLKKKANAPCRRRSTTCAAMPRSASAAIADIHRGKCRFQFR